MIDKGNKTVRMFSWGFALAFFVIFFCSNCTADQFCIEDKNLGPVPADIMRIILNKEKDDDLKTCKFIGRNINLTGKGKAQDYAVTTARACMCGAAICPIWALRKIGNSYVLVASDGGYSMNMLKKKHNGLKDLSFEAATAGWSQKRLWRFNGKQYTKIKNVERSLSNQ